MTCAWSRCWPGPCGPASARSVATSRCPSAPACCACGPGRPRTSWAWPGAGPGTHNARRRFVEAQVLRALSDEYRARLGRSGVDGADDERRRAEEQRDLAQRLRRVPEVSDALDRMWPRLSPHEFLHDLLGARPLLAAAGQGDPERAGGAAALPAAQHLARRRCRGRSGDAALIDEARTLLGPRRGAPGPDAGQAGRGGDRRRRWASGRRGWRPRPSRRRAPSTASEDEIRAFGHIVVDEVQDLSPMQLRMLARRSLSGSMTVVGDIAQATGPWAPAGWDDITRHLSPQRPTAPGGADGQLPHPGRGGGAGGPGPGRGRARDHAAAPGAPVGLPAPDRRHQPVRARRARWPSLAREEVAAVAPGRVAVLGPAVMLPELTRALDEAGLDPIDPRDPAGDGLAAGLVVLPADETNGLEFDSVIVVEPSLIAAVGDDLAGEGPPVATTRGLRTLYVALTRPTRRLTVLHAEPLPVELR